MDIVVIGLEGSERLRRFLGESGCNAHRTLPGTLADRLVQGVILFDDGQANLYHTLGHEYARVRFLGVPLIVVADPDRIMDSERLYAAGAACVCASHVSDTEILSEIQTRCTTSSLEPEIRVQLVEPLIEAARVALGEMAHTELTARAVYRQAHPVMLGELAAMLALKSARVGSLVLDVTDRTALALTRRVLGETRHVTDHAIVHDCIGEIANVIAGQAKALLAESAFRFTFATPTILSAAGAHAARTLPGNDYAVVAFCSDAGEFALQWGRR